MTDTLPPVLALFAEVTDRDTSDLNAESPIANIEINSLEEVHLIMLLEERMEVEVTLAQVKACRTVGDLAALLDRLRQGNRTAV